MAHLNTGQALPSCWTLHRMSHIRCLQILLWSLQQQHQFNFFYLATVFCQSFCVKWYFSSSFLQEFYILFGEIFRRLITGAMLQCLACRQKFWHSTSCQCIRNLIRHVCVGACLLYTYYVYYFCILYIHTQTHSHTYLYLYMKSRYIITLLSRFLEILLRSSPFLN